MSHLQELLFEIAAVFNTCQLCSWYCKAAPLSQGRTGKKKIYFFFLKKKPNKTTTLQFIFWNAIVRTRQRFCRITQLPACSPKHRGGGCGSFQQAEFFYWGKRLRDRWEKRGGGGGRSLEQAESKVWEQKGPDSAVRRLQIQHTHLLPFKPPLGLHGERWGLKGDGDSVEPGGGCLTKKGHEGRRKWLPWARK